MFLNITVRKRKRGYVVKKGKQCQSLFIKRLLHEFAGKQNSVKLTESHNNLKQCHIWLFGSLVIKPTFMFYCKYLHCKEIHWSGVRDLEKAGNTVLHERSRR